MVHARREFIELATGKTAPIATEALRRIAALYAIEAEVRGEPPEIRRAVRQAKSRPLVEDLFAWFSAQLARLPGRAPTAGAAGGLTRGPPVRPGGSIEGSARCPPANVPTRPRPG